MAQVCQEGYIHVTAFHCCARGQGFANFLDQSDWDTCILQGQELGDPRALPHAGRVVFLPQSHAAEPLTLGMWHC